MVILGRWKLWLFLTVLPGTTLLGEPASWAQSLSQGLAQDQEPSQEQIERFCANYGQLSGSERKQYNDEYEKYCRRPALQPETTIIEPVDPQAPSQQQPPPQQPQPQRPQKPEPAPVEPEPEIQPAKPEPQLPEPEPRRVDLIGRLALEGPIAKQPGERQRIRVTVVNRGEDAPPGGRLWARVFLSDRDAPRGQAASGFAPGRRIRLSGVPGPGRSREHRVQVTLPTAVADGEYWWCVLIDERQAIDETDESNNTACAQTEVAGGGEDESESALSSLFGSQVKKLKEDEDVTGQPAGANAGMKIPPSPPEDIKTLEHDDPPMSLDAPDLEILRVSGQGPPQLGDSHEGFALGDAVLSKQSYAVYGWPYIYELKVRNNGGEPAKFQPYYMFDDEDAAHIGVISGFGTLGDGEAGTSIAAGEIKRVRMFVDLRAESLTVDQILRLEIGEANVGITLFLGAVDAPGNAFAERVYHDANIDNHVDDVEIDVVSTRLYRVALRAPKFEVQDTGDRFGAGELRYVELRFADTSVKRWLRRSCGSGERGYPNAYVTDGLNAWWDVDDALLIREDTRIRIDFDDDCGAPDSGPGTYPLVGYAPLGSYVHPETITREDDRRHDADTRSWSRFWEKHRIQLPFDTRPTARDCTAIEGTSSLFEPPLTISSVGETGYGADLHAYWHICVDKSVPSSRYEPEIVPVEDVPRIGTAIDS